MTAINKLMSHIYARNKLFDKMHKIRKDIKASNKKQKNYAKSHIFVHGKLSEFKAGQTMFDKEMIELSQRLKKMFCFEHDFNALTKELNNECDKELELLRHSE